MAKELKTDPHKPGKRPTLHVRSGAKRETSGKTETGGKSRASSATSPHDPTRESGMEQGMEGNKTQRNQEDRIGIGNDEDRSLD